MQRRLVGSQVGEYELLRLLGRGGMGEVYEGLQRLIGKKVAVKVLLPHLSREAESLARFLAEARAVNAIRHRGIVDIFGFGTMDDGSSYCVMELLEGRSFEEIIDERAPLPANEVLHWSLQVLDALDAAHLAGVVHRDLKPSNVMLLDGAGSRAGAVKLLDFGIAKLDAAPGKMTPQTHVSVALGTPQYMSPEQAKGEPVGAGTDLYAWGSIMFEMLTGELPFDGSNAVETLYARCERPAPRLRSVNPTVPRELDELVEWLLRTDPAQRAQSAGEVLERVSPLRRRFPLAAETPLGRLKLSGGARPEETVVETADALSRATTNPTLPTAKTPTGAPFRMPSTTAIVPPPHPPPEPSPDVTADLDPEPTTAVRPPPRTRPGALLWAWLLVCGLAAAAAGAYLLWPR